MSELINTTNRSRQFLWQLLSTASALALIGTVNAIPSAKASEDQSHPTLWIELGGQLQRLDTSEEQFAPSFLFETPRPRSETGSPLDAVHLPKSGVDGEGKITFQPQGSSWNFSAAVRYGRSQSHQHRHQQSYPTAALYIQPTHGAPPISSHAFQFIDARKDSKANHTIIDFQVGKDVGLGMFGAGSSSVVNAGVRFAQFSAKSTTAFASDPDARHSLGYFYLSINRQIPFLKSEYYHLNQAQAAVSRNFHGVGPSLAWNASAPMLGNAQTGQFALDWGVNAALLFGRHKADTHHQTTGEKHVGKYYAPRYTTHTNTPPDQHRSHSVTVPNVGGFAGFTYQLENFKVSAGYRADFFFGAMDGGIDTRKTENQNFYGPFATISIGLGG